MKRLEALKKFAAKHGVLLSLVLVVAGTMSTQSTWWTGQAEAPEELL